VEGAFVMGLGLMKSEAVEVDAESGHLVSDSTWSYKIPTAACIPRTFNVTFLKVS
jgi:indole-3-acetaldehyde oxidase